MNKRIYAPHLRRRKRQKKGGIEEQPTPPYRREEASESPDTSQSVETDHPVSDRAETPLSPKYRTDGWLGKTRILIRKRRRNVKGLDNA